MKLQVLCRVTPAPKQVRRHDFFFARTRTIFGTTRTEWLTRDVALSLVSNGHSVDVVDREYTVIRDEGGEMVRAVTGWNTPVRFEDKQELIHSRWP